MSALAAVPGAVRMPRPVTLRRAALTALFLGGFLALALLFGSDAHASTGDGLSESATGAAGAATGTARADDAAHTVRHAVHPAQRGAEPERADHERAASARTSASHSSASARSVPSAGAASAATAPVGTEAGKPGKSEKAAESAVTAKPATSAPSVPSTGKRTGDQAQRAARRTADDMTGSVRKSATQTRHVTRPVGDTVRELSGAARQTAGAGARLTDPLAPLTGMHRHGGGGSGEHPGDGSGGTGHAGGPKAHPSEHAEDGHTGGHGATQWRPYGSDRTGTADHAAAVDGTDQGGNGPAPRLPLHGTPGVPVAGGTSPNASAAGPRTGGPHQLAGYVSDMELLGPPAPGAAHAAKSAPTRERAGDILEFPG